MAKKADKALKKLKEAVSYLEEQLAAGENTLDEPTQE